MLTRKEFASVYRRFEETLAKGEYLISGNRKEGTIKYRHRDGTTKTVKVC